VQAHWLPADEERWQAHLDSDDLDEPAEVVFYCPECAGTTSSSCGARADTRTASASTTREESSEHSFSMSS
jgi:hypothetical protein